MLKIVHGPNEVLSQKAKPVTIREDSKIDSSILKFIEEMKVALAHTKDPEGVGLAAPQVGKSLQIFIVKPTRKSKEQIFINPKIVSEIVLPKRTDEEHSKLEGCLSLPTIWGEVLRSESVTLEYRDEFGKKHTKTFTDFPATIVQHEYDHLQGILFPKRVLEQNGLLYKSKKDKKGKDIFEEIKI